MEGIVAECLSVMPSGGGQKGPGDRIDCTEFNLIDFIENSVAHNFKNTENFNGTYTAKR